MGTVETLFVETNAWSVFQLIDINWLTVKVDKVQLTVEKEILDSK